VLSFRKKRKWQLWITLAFLGGFLAAAAAFGSVFLPGPLTEAKTLVVPHGTAPREVATLLGNNGIVYCPFLFRLAVKYGAANVLKAGEYQLAPGQSVMDIVQMMHDGRSVTRLFTVAEGLTSNEIARLLNAMPTLGGDTVPVPPEGSLLPESYRYIYGDSRASLVVRMQKAMQDALGDLWEKRDPGLPLASKQEALVMASVVEKETGKASERPRIAGVFYNRLRHPMRLQSDPTVIYAIMLANGFMDHDIEHADLGFASPYNTYLNDGLPPGPICNPGRAAIAAALHPEQNAYFYFVADGAGGHVFSHSLDEHNRNVTKWNQTKNIKP
jgi:UPF0755 protein